MVRRKQELNSPSGGISRVLYFLFIAATALFILLAVQTNHHRQHIFAHGQGVLCSREYKLVFKSTDLPGTPSFITQENQTVNLIPGSSSPIPPVVLRLYYRDASSTSSEWILDSHKNAKVQVAIVPPRLITGDTATLSRGEALFPSITVDGSNEPGVTYHFEFTTVIPNFPQDTPLKLVTGSINLLPAQERNRFNHIDFANYGFLFREGQKREIPVASVLPPIYMEPKALSGHVLPSSGPTVGVTVTALDGVVDQSGSVSFTGTSIITITGIRFIPNDPLTVKQTVLTFTGTDGTTTSSISSGVLNVSYFRTRCKFLTFDSSSSFFQYENVGKTAVLGIALPPIVVQVASSDYASDSSNSGMIIRAHSPQASLIGAEAVVVQGKAVFNRLTFVDYAPESAVITFTAGPYGTLGVSGYDLYSGAVGVSLTAVKAKYMEFDQSSFITSDTAVTVQVKSDNTFIIPSIVVVFKDSGYVLDTSLSGPTLMVVSSVPSIEPVATRNTAVRNGVAAFTNLEFKGGVDGVSFTLQITDETGDREAIRSARITLAGADSTTSAGRTADLLKCIPLATTASSDCRYSIAFDASAQTLISSEGQSLFATLGEFIPEINIVLKDVFGPVDSISSVSIIPRLVAYTGDDPLSEYLLVTTDDANIGKWRGKYWTFTCLRFAERPAGLVKIKFAAITNTSILYQGINVVETGYVTIAPTVTSVYGLRFARTDSLFLFTNQPSSAVVNIALPQITIEVIDSIYQFDSTANNIVIVASTSTGAIDADGSTAIVKNGVATFTTLKFSTISDNPILTFRAQQTSEAVAGKTVATGTISVTQLPTPTAQIVFATTKNENNNFTGQYQSLTFETLADAVVFASVTARDSAHQFSDIFEDTVTIEVKCEEATLQTSSSIQIGGAPSSYTYANFTTRFISFNPSYVGAPIYLRYAVIASTNSLLVGKELIAGPIVIRSAEEEGTCTRQINSPQVVAAFGGSVSSFVAKQKEMVDSLSYLMGIESSRLLVRSVLSTSGLDLVTVTQWTGVRVLIEFGPPLATSVNQKTPAQLATEFASLRPMCMEPINGFALKDVYYAASEPRCERTLFQKAQNETLMCLNEGITPECQCFDEYLFSPMGSACARTPDYAELFTSLCNGDVSACKEAAVLSICTDVINANSRTYWWVFGVVTPCVVIGVVLFVLYKKGIICAKEKTTMHTQIDEQY